MNKHLIAALLTGALMTPMAAHAHGWKDKDTNGDGTITKAEFTAHSNKKFDEMDKNKDGKLTADEQGASTAAMKQKWQEWKNKMKDDNTGTHDSNGNLRGDLDNDGDVDIHHDNVRVENRMDPHVSADKQPAGYEKH